MLTFGLLLLVMHAAVTAGRNVAAGVSGAGDNRLPYYRLSRLVAGGLYSFAAVAAVKAVVVVNCGW